MEKGAEIAIVAETVAGIVVTTIAGNAIVVEIAAGVAMGMATGIQAADHNSGSDMIRIQTSCNRIRAVNMLFVSLRLGRALSWFWFAVPPPLAPLGDSTLPKPTFGI